MLEYVAIAEQHFGMRFVRVTNSEYRSMDGCPWCKDGGKSGDGDRFKLFTTGRSGPRVWCRQCDGRMFLDTLDEHKKLSDEEIEQLNAVLKARREEEKQEQQTALETIMRVQDHIGYNGNLKTNQDALDYWHKEGINDKAIARHMLGWCPACPTAPYSPSYTMPVMYQGRLFNIRHRLEKPNGSGKYRPHMKGLPVMLYNADDLDRESEFGFLLEGEKKSIVVSQETGYPNVGIMGMSSFSPSWVTKFSKWGVVFVALDPDADERAYSIAKMFGSKGAIVTLPVKADDFFVRHGGTMSDFARYTNMARRA
jgi:hypothetical protein